MNEPITYEFSIVVNGHTYASRGEVKDPKFLERALDKSLASLMANVKLANPELINHP